MKKQLKRLECPLCGFVGSVLPSGEFKWHRNRKNDREWCNGLQPAKGDYIEYPFEPRTSDPAKDGE